MHPAPARREDLLLLTQRGRWLQRDEVVERLWPNLSPEAALRDFKVALNALNKAIEPGPPPKHLQARSQPLGAVAPLTFCSSAQ